MVFFFKYTATTEIYTYLHTLSLHDALPICSHSVRPVASAAVGRERPGPFCTSRNDEKRSDSSISQNPPGPDCAKSRKRCSLSFSASSAATCSVTSKRMPMTPPHARRLLWASIHRPSLVLVRRVGCVGKGAGAENGRAECRERV